MMRGESSPSTPRLKRQEMRQHYIEQGFSAEEAETFVARLSVDRDRWLTAHVTHVLGLIPDGSGSSKRGPLTLGLSHIVGAMIALAPYFLLTDLRTAAYVSISLAAVTLLAAGSLKTRATGGRSYVSAVEFLVLGMVAVIVGYAVGYVAR
jgi:VIT1/CCC1 family predicted Fe2+/Mn2+ transporter